MPFWKNADNWKIINTSFPSDFPGPSTIPSSNYTNSEVKFVVKRSGISPQTRGYGAHKIYGHNQLAPTMDELTRTSGRWRGPVPGVEDEYQRTRTAGRRRVPEDEDQTLMRTSGRRRGPAGDDGPWQYWIVVTNKWLQQWMNNNLRSQQRASTMD